MLPHGFALVSQSPWPTGRRAGFLSRDSLRVEHEPHKLVCPGASPGPATKFSAGRNDQPASVLPGLLISSLGFGSLLLASRPSPARLFFVSAMGHSPTLTGLRQNRRAHRLAFFLSVSPSLRRWV